MQVLSFFFFIPSIVFDHLFSLSLLVVTPGSHSRLFSPPDGGPYLRNTNIMLWRKGWDCANEYDFECKKHSSKWATWKMKQGSPGDRHIPGTVVRNAKGYNLSTVLSSWRLLLCYAYADGPQSQCHLPRGLVRLISMRGDFCCFLLRYIRFLRNIQNKKQ